ncbi:MAG: carbamoyl-phosphate synthase [Labilithrix sp.]|nr:carbamoyl-phosphate synthase [Labilithrix sp.]
MTNALLLGADYYGTLAAARCYGKHGIDVTMADESVIARGMYSRHVKKRLVHPPYAKPGVLVDWLLDYGAKNPGTLLYAPNDHLAWLFAAHRERLEEVFSMYTPSEDVMMTLLDKKRLHEACASVGLDVPKTQMLGDPGTVIGHRWPVILKPRTQVCLVGGIKGFIAHDERELETGLARYRRLVRFHEAFADRYPGIGEPLVQEYSPSGETSIFSVSGFVTERGVLVSRASMKVLQRPRKVGIGLCFEGRPLEHDLADKLAALCRRLGYYGCFEAELIAEGDRRLLIDFNPRFYSQMGFEIARGLPLPMLVLHAARGDDAQLARELARARTWMPTGNEVYCHKTMLDLLLTLQGLSGRMSRGDIQRWRQWYAAAELRGVAADAVRDPEDRMPAVVDAAQWMQEFGLHFRSFMRSFVLNQ